MAFDVTALSNYTIQNNFPLVTKSLFEAKTMKLMTPMTGIKSSETVNILETDSVFQAGGSCGFSASGSTALSQRSLTVGKIKINEALCPKTLESYYLQLQLPTGSRYENLPFEEVYSNEKAGKIAQQMEVAIWQGDITLSDDNLKHFDGLLKLIDASAVAVAADSSNNTETITSSNVLAKFDKFYESIPEQLLNKNDFVIFCGLDVFRIFSIALKNQNLFHYDGVASHADMELVLPGTNIKVIGVNGLNKSNDNTNNTGLNRIVGLRTSNMFFGTDLMNEEDRFEIFFAREADEIRFVAEFKAGTQVAFPEDIVQYGK
jgi:hypothetical protein